MIDTPVSSGQGMTDTPVSWQPLMLQAKVHIKVPRLKVNLNFGPPQVQSV